MLYSSGIILVAALTAVSALPAKDSKPETKSLDWAPCKFDDYTFFEPEHLAAFDCATLDVPLDYSKKSDDCGVLPLQLARAKATKEPVKGTILVNPGGPGSNGVEFIWAQGDELVEKFGGHFNIAAHDPRGTGRTLSFNCSATIAGLERRDWRPELPVVDTWDNKEIRELAWEVAGQTAEACYNANKDTGRLISTPFTVRDMVEIVDALNEDGLLHYYGLSYGTLIGHVFAAMFPERVGSMVLDAVVLPEIYFEDGSWKRSWEDAHLILERIFADCIAAGTEQCPLLKYVKDSEPTPERFMDMLVEAFSTPDDSRPAALNAISNKSMLITSLYGPSQIPAVLQLVDTWFGLMANPNMTVPEPPVPPPSDELVWNRASEVDMRRGINCADSHFRAGSIDQMQQRVEDQLGETMWADAWVDLWTCARWKFDAAEEFHGPYTNVETKNPILVVNGILDPVTPYSTAWDFASGFVNSTFVTHKGYGHGTIANPSNCTDKILTEYFMDGTMPEQGAECEPNESAWDLGMRQASEASEEA